MIKINSDSRVWYKQVDRNNIPKHIAIIMDGNGRWAKKRHLPRIMGHHAGIRSVRETVRVCGELGVQVLTLYAFSTENWKRPPREVNALMKLLAATIARETNDLIKNNVRVHVIGRLEKLPVPVQESLKECISATAGSTGLILNLALNYGGRQEIIDAVNRIIHDKVTDVTETVFPRYLYTVDLPDPDLLIRTSYELRISNFLLWQIAYTELVFTPVLWPSFRKKHLIEAIGEYQSRVRRYGGA